MKRENDDDRRKCGNCGRRISVGRQRRRKYCSAACRQAAYRARQREEAQP